MANVKITDLTAATSLAGTESIEIVQGGTNKKTTLDDLPVSAATTTALAGKSDTGHNHAGTYQPASSNLDEYAAVNPTSAGLALLDDADASAQRTTLGLGDAATKNTGTSAGTVAAGDHAHSGTYEAALGNPAANGYVLSSTTGGTRSWVAPGGGGGGDMYKATYDTDNDGTVDAAEDSAKLAGTTPTAAGLALLDDADAAAQRTTLGLGNAATKNTGTSAGTVAAGDHAHAGTYQPYDANLPAWPSAVSATEVGYLDGVTSAIQTQIDAKLASSSYTAADVLTKIKTVDGSGSGLDADTIDGVESSAFALKAGDADVDMNNYKISEAKTVSFNGEVSASGTSGAVTCAFSGGQKMKVVPTGAITSFVLSFPGVGHYQLRIEMGTSYAITWTFSGVTAYQIDTAAPTTAANKSTFVNFFYDGTNCFYSRSQQV